ncbi:hypothetical protein GCM10009641_61830 [Mycobacterium cookii]|uniref:HTH cro/C1-type domain-containing protein n=2 Tax=Nocardioides furvisabuli TaxID=375542 RepID=A0ABN2X9V8_9ACTN
MAHIIGVLGHNLRHLREAIGLSQADLGRAAGISRNHYQLLEVGRAANGGLANPRLSTLRALATVLGVRAESLIMEPVPHSVWRWSDVDEEMQDDVMAQLLDALLDASAAELGVPGAAFVASELKSLTLGIGVSAPDEISAAVVAEPVILRALQAADLPARLTADSEVSIGVDDLASEADA